jgi:hypothetical protein
MGVDPMTANRLHREDHPMSQLANTKALHPADGSPRWSVDGDAGSVQYDLLGNHLTGHPAVGEMDSMGKRWADEVRGVAEVGDDDTVFELLAGHYRTMANGGTR